MADIRTLTVDGTTYNIKDATARADIIPLQTNVTTLQTNVTTLQTNVTTLQENTADLPQIRENVTQLQENTADLPQIRENVENNSDDIRDLKSAISQYGIKTNASGELVTVKDAAENRPISNIVADSSATSIRRCAKNLWCSNKDFSPDIGTSDEITVYKNKSEIKIKKVSVSLGYRLATLAQITLPAGRYYCSTPDLKTDAASAGFFIYNMNGGTILTRFNKNTSSYFTLSAFTTISIGVSLGINDAVDGLYHILISVENASYEDYNGNDYTVTNGEVAETINTLNGLNNIWTNIGNISFDYWADTKGYIDEKDTIVKALIAKELPSMIADSALTANDFRIVNNTLYRATTSIASGETLTVDTNVVATTLAEIIKPLLS